MTTLAYTVQDVFDRTTGILDRDIKDSTLGPATFKKSKALLWVKDCYDEIADALHMPIVTVSFDLAVGTTYFDVPGDIWDGFKGIVGLSYNPGSLSNASPQPVLPGYRFPLIDQWGNDWLNPPGMQTCTLYMEYPTTGRITLVPLFVTGSSNNAFLLQYIQEQPAPTDTTSSIPTAYKPFVHIMPQYLLGRFLETDRQGRGAAYMAEFQGRLRKRQIRNKRNQRRRGSDAFMTPLQQYARLYGVR